MDALTHKDGKGRKLGKFEESFEKECFGLAASKGRRNGGFSERSYWDKFSLIKKKKTKITWN